MKKIQLNHVCKDGCTILYDFSASDDVVVYFSGKPFRIEYPEVIEAVPDAVAVIPFVCNVLPIVWLTDSELVLPELDQMFYECIPELKKGYETMFPESTFLGKLQVDKIIQCNREKTTRCAAFYSGGLDSVHTLIRHLDEQPDLISIWGSDINYENVDGWALVHQAIEEASKQFHLPDIVIRSTFREFDREDVLNRQFQVQLRDNWWHGVKHGIGLLGHVAPYAFLHGLSTMYIASSNCPADGSVRCASNPLTDNQVRFVHCKVVHDGFECSRQDKVHNIVEFCHQTQNDIRLHVCWESQTGSNCCRCEKCYRTMAGFLAEGENPVHYGFQEAENTLPAMQSKIVAGGVPRDVLRRHWTHIHNRACQNKQMLLAKPYWKQFKWVLKADFEHPETLTVPLSCRIRRKLSQLSSFCHNRFRDTRVMNVLSPLRRLHGRLHEYQTIVRPIIRQRRKRPNAVFLVLTPHHKNLGDHAIAKAEVDMLRRIRVDYIEITEDVAYILQRYKRLGIMNGRPIFVNGGGNLGTLWILTEQLHRTIIEQNPDSPILFFPNTLYYEASPWGEQEKQRSVEIYGKHRSLHLYARERTSYKAMSELYRHVKLIPDMVLSLNEYTDTSIRRGCLLCLRSDCEKTRSEDEEATVRQQAAALFGDQVRNTDMMADHAFPLEQREQQLRKKMDEFKSAQLVITDRLHGMIFCAITATPCIVIDSKSPKVRGCYEWIRHLDYIRFADNACQIADLYHQIPQNEHHYDNTHLLPYFHELEQDILKIVKPTIKSQ